MHGHLGVRRRCNSLDGRSSLQTRRSKWWPAPCAPLCRLDCKALFICSSEADGVVQRWWRVNCHIGLQGIVETSDKELDLLPLRELDVAARQRHELLAVLFHRPCAAQQSHLAQGRLCDARPKSLMQQLLETPPIRFAANRLQMIVPQLRSIGHMERRHPNFTVFRCVVASKI